MSRIQLFMIFHGRAFITNPLCPAWIDHTKGCPASKCNLGIKKSRHWVNGQWEWFTSYLQVTYMKLPIYLCCCVVKEIFGCLDLPLFLRAKVLKIRTICHARDLQNWLSLVNSSIYYSRTPVKFTKYCLIQWISKLLGWHYLVNVVLLE